MTQTLKTTERLGVVDALRGFALLAIVLLHNLEHYNLFLPLEFTVPGWLQTIDKYMWDTMFFLFAGKAYATFSLLFGFSFYIQLHNAEKRGTDFRGRFAWRLCLLFLFAQLHALFYNGDILLLYAVVGSALIPVCKLNDKTVFWIAVILLLQPYEWGRAIYAMIDPNYVPVTGHFIPYAERAQVVTANGSFLEVLRSNITDGQLYSNIWQVENGRLFQTAALFMFGMLLGRRKYFIKSEESICFWKKMLKYAVIAFIPLYCLKTFVSDLITNPSVLVPYKIVVPSYVNFAFMVILVSIFTLLWFKKNSGYGWQSLLIPYGRMSLTNYISQSIMGVCIYYGFGLSMYRYAGATGSFLIALCIFTIQLIFSRWWLARHKQGPLEFLWRKGTWIGTGR
ncbi:uncharacterized protein SAMN05444349_10515 [Bacteroides faecichinchillae]|uniref:DUF418 domain-containing protein n=1 Tax=Bacteroides faecichinchillae TaxID=871325 RepID=A0A1M4VJA6_9BACE|nr:DUF418 domain-containing protein [Bacteroides faecichinchillae]THG55936.1 DUF418 domain-containing protein [Bacteroides faecichinchillae]SHE69064.1 uncharacterized protein SAMN05444349_10515 [Bacteroides faecichinchillae]